MTYLSQHGLLFLTFRRYKKAKFHYRRCKGHEKQEEFFVLKLDSDRVSSKQNKKAHGFIDFSALLQMPFIKKIEKMNEFILLKTL